MIKYIKRIGIMLLLLFSFIYTQKLVMIAKEYDDIMIEIENNMDSYKVKPIEATIDDKTIIPGINGKEVDINNSYKRMKKYGKYSVNLFVYKVVPPKDKLSDNYDKFIIGGSTNKHQVSIIMNVEDVIDKYKEKINLAVSKEIKEIKNQNYILGTFEDNLLEIKSISNQKQYYCYTLNYNLEKLEECSKEKFYTIVPSIIVKNNLKQLQDMLKSGSIIYIEKTNDLASIINYIQNKGYEIVLLDELLEE